MLTRWRARASNKLVSTKQTSKLAMEEARSVIQFKRAARDALYIMVDLWPTMKRAHREYGAFHKYINDRAKGKVNHEEFRDVDMNVLKRMLEEYKQTRGPLTGFDMRWFYWLYLFMFVNIGYTMVRLLWMREQRAHMQGAMKDRRELFDKDYIEE
jgi:hypothetical protein